MKAIKMIGLAALTALMAMAFVGATSASAGTKLCTTDSSPCNSAVTSVHETSVGKAKLLTSLGTTECNVLFESTEVGTGGGTTQTVKGNFTYSNCELGGSSCTATEENGPVKIVVERIANEEAKLTGEGLVKLVCGSIINCAYDGTGLEGTSKGALVSTEANGESSTSEKVTNKESGGFVCPKTSKLDIKTTPLAATYIASS